MVTRVGVIICACSTEAVFLGQLLRECLHFSKDIVVSYTDKMYNGDHEDLSYINKVIDSFPDVKFVKYDVDLSLPKEKMQGVQNRPTAYWHNLARFTAINALNPDTDWVFVLDADEIPEGVRVSQWLQQIGKDLSINECYKLATYWYFKYPIFQAQSYEDSILLIHKSHLTPNNVFGDNERDFTITNSQTTLKREVMGLDGKPLWHHFSFVRTKENLKKKLSSWGHRDDLLKNVNIDDVVNYVFRDAGVNDFVHGYKYNIVDNKFDILI